MVKAVSNVPVIVLIVAFLTIAIGFLTLSQNETIVQVENTTSIPVPIIQLEKNYSTSPQGTFIKYSKLIGNGSFDEAISLVVIDSGTYQKPNQHSMAIIKGEMTSIYGEDGKNFEVLDVKITAQEPLDVQILLGKRADDGYVFNYEMRYNLQGGLGVLSEKSSVVGIDGEWWVVYPDVK